MNILDHVAIRVPCSVCSEEFTVPASVILEGEEAIVHGCPGCSDYECEARFVASLADQQAVEDLEAAWERFEASVRAHGAAGALLVGVPTTVAQTRDDRVWRRKAIQRWENEGGHLLDGRGTQH